MNPPLPDNDLKRVIAAVCRSSVICRLVLVGFLTQAALQTAQADGMFVAPPFVWDKHKDINEPTQKAILVFDGGHEDLMLQVKYDGPVAEFGWLVPVPNLPTVEKGSMKCFYELSQYTQKHFDNPWGHGATKGGTYGTAGIDSAAAPEPPVKVIEIKTVGAYDIAVLSTKDATALAKWLAENHFSIPTNATSIIDEYVQRHWFFVAAKVNLNRDAASVKSATEKLSAGELNPLHIRFDTEQCVYPLKISAGNGSPTEVQVYVLSPEPLLERTMLEKKLPIIRSNDMAQAVRSAQNFRETQAHMRQIREGAGGLPLPPDPDEQKAFEYRSKTPYAGEDDLLRYAKITRTDLPECCNECPILAAKPFWLTKQTWVLKPEEMQDLHFESAIAFFKTKLATDYGYYAVASLSKFQADAVPAVIAAMRDTNPVVRITTAEMFDYGMESITDPRLVEAAQTWLKDSEPKVRSAAVDILIEYPNWKPQFAELLVLLLKDEDAGVRHFVVFGLPRFRGDVQKHLPAIRELLKDKDINIRTTAMNLLQRMGESVSHEELLQFLSVPNRETIGITISQLRTEDSSGERKYDLSNTEALLLLHNSEPFARMFGLAVLYQNANPESVELTMPLLKDAEPILRKRAAATLRALSGQHFTEEQAADWEKWWSENKNGFVVQLHPEELRPTRRSPDNLRAPNRANPRPSTP